MKVTVVIPIFNCEKYLDNCIKGILAQTYKDWELILVDDGSTDKSYEICSNYEKEDDRIITFHHEKSKGAGPARNKGIDLSSGELIMFIDADDKMADNMIEKLVSAISSNESDVAICGYETFVEGVSDKNREKFTLPAKLLKDSKETKDFFANTFPEGMAGYLWNKIYRKSIIEENNIRFPDMRRLQDGVFNVLYFNCAKSCNITDDILYYYRVNAQVDMFRKCPRDYYDLIRQFTVYFLDTKKQWGNYTNDNIARFFLNELGTCIENSYSSNWNMDKSERIRYYNDIVNDEIFKELSKQVYLIGRYRKMIIKNLTKKRYALNTIIIKTKFLVKKSFKSLFYYIKRK